MFLKKKTTHGVRFCNMSHTCKSHVHRISLPKRSVLVLSWALGCGERRIPDTKGGHRYGAHSKGAESDLTYTPDTTKDQTKAIAETAGDLEHS